MTAIKKPLFRRGTYVRVVAGFQSFHGWYQAPSKRRGRSIVKCTDGCTFSVPNGTIEKVPAKGSRRRPLTVETKEETAKRLARNERARARRWSKTGVSDATIRWMRDTGQL